MLKYGPTLRNHIDKIGGYWDGPLDKYGYFLHIKKFEGFSKKTLSEKILPLMTDFEIHPLYNRDFFQGLTEGLGEKVQSPSHRISFFNRTELFEFLESGDHGFNISFNNQKYYRSRTNSVYLFNLPRKGEIDRYFAGVLSSGEICYDKKDQLVCRVNILCKSELEKFGILYEEVKNRLTISPFYVMLFAGELPFEIFSAWVKAIEETSGRSLRRASYDALIHWRLIFGKKHFKPGPFPFLSARESYYRFGPHSVKKLEVELKGKRFDFVDKRIIKRCHRWYNMSNVQIGEKQDQNSLN
jgi:hypothetical protein